MNIIVYCIYNMYIILPNKMLSFSKKADKTLLYYLYIIIRSSNSIVIILLFMYYYFISIFLPFNMPSSQRVDKILYYFLCLYFILC